MYSSPSRCNLSSFKAKWCIVIGRREISCQRVIIHTRVAHNPYFLNEVARMCWPISISNWCFYDVWRIWWPTSIDVDMCIMKNWRRSIVCSRWRLGNPYPLYLMVPWQYSSGKQPIIFKLGKRCLYKDFMSASHSCLDVESAGKGYFNAGHNLSQKVLKTSRGGRYLLVSTRVKSAMFAFILSNWSILPDVVLYILIFPDGAWYTPMTSLNSWYSSRGTVCGVPVSSVMVTCFDLEVGFLGVATPPFHFHSIGNQHYFASLSAPPVV